MQKLDILENPHKYAKRIHDIDTLREFLLEFFKDTKGVKVYLFGSRAKGKFNPASDIDLAIEPKTDIRDRIAILRMILEDSNLPQKVDVVYLNDNPQFKEMIKEEWERWI